MQGCRSLLEDTDKFIRKNEILVTKSSGLGSKTQKALKKLKWDSAAVNELRDRMISNTMFLNAYNNSFARSVSSAETILSRSVSDIASVSRLYQLTLAQSSVPSDK